MKKINKSPIPVQELSKLIDLAQTRVETKIQKVRELEIGLDDKSVNSNRLAIITRILMIVLSAFLATRVVADNLFSKKLPNINSSMSNSEKNLIITKSPINPKPEIKENTGRASHPLVTIIYTILSVILAVFAGLEAAFKPGERATEVEFLRVRCDQLISDIEYRWATSVERLGVSEEALDNANQLFDRLNKESVTIQTRVAQLGITVRPVALDNAERT